MKLSVESSIKLCEIVIRQDRKNYIIENLENREFYEMTPISIEAITAIEKKLSLGEIQDTLRHKYPLEDIDMLLFTQQLLELGLIKEVDGQPIELSAMEKSSHGFQWIRSKVAHLFFNGLINQVYWLILVINAGLLIYQPHLFPHFKVLFIFDSMMLNTFTWFCISLFVVMNHEFGHILAVRSYDLPVRLGIGHRLFFLVLETDMTPVWRLSSKNRNVPFLAGIWFDNIFLFFALILQIVFPQAHPIFIGILGVLVFDILLKLIYQCCFYMKTDLYYVFENLSGCYNLMENAKVWLMKIFPLANKEMAGTATFEGEEKVVRSYAIFYIVGMVLTGLIFFTYFLPQMIYAFDRTIPLLMKPISNPYFWDAFVFMIQSLLMVGLLFYSWTRKYLLSS